MNWEILKSYSTVGDNIIQSVKEAEIRVQNSRNLFTEFISKHGFTAWHIHDGWVKYNYVNGDILHYNDITIGWIDEHSGFSHSLICPNVGEKMIIVKDSPDINNLNSFPLYCYDVVKKDNNKFNGVELGLKLIEVKECEFIVNSNSYQFCYKKFSKLFSFFKSKNK